MLSGSNLTIIDKPLSFKPNSYFIFNWGNETVQSNVIFASSNPDWKQEIEIKIPIKDDLNTLDNKNQFIENLYINLGITVFSKIFRKEELENFKENQLSIINNSFYDQGDSSMNPFSTVNNFNSNFLKDDFIGETNISIYDILTNFKDSYGFDNKNNYTHDGFYHIYNRQDNIVGQIHLEILFDEYVIKLFRELKINISEKINYSKSLINETTNNFLSANNKLISFQKNSSNSNLLLKDAKRSLDIKSNADSNEFITKYKESNELNNLRNDNFVKIPYSKNDYESESQSLWKIIEENQVYNIIKYFIITISNTISFSYII